MSRNATRRDFLKQSTALGAAMWVGSSTSTGWTQERSANAAIRFACIGVEGKGSSDRDDAGRHGEIVALCDIDDERLEKAAARYPNAKKYNDYRKMYDEMAGQIDAITVSTPDHSHAPAAIRGMKEGKHCFCQKPLTYTVTEARMMRELAAEKKLCTQMGNQGTAASGLREAAAQIRRGDIGQVKEVHIWTNRPIWPQGGGRPTEVEACPPNVHWDLFLGPAPERPYSSAYHPFKWRGWIDFGTGALGDMACHTLNMSAMALDLFNPLTVEAMPDPEWTGEARKETYPKFSTIVYEFGPRGDFAPCKLFWYDGGKRPDNAICPEAEFKASGSLVIGEKGMIHSSSDYHNEYGVYPAASFKDLSKPEIVTSPGHFTEFANAIKENKPELAKSNFDYAGRLTETVLLGNVALRAGKKVEWDAVNLKIKNLPEAQQYVSREYRKGFEL
ncbi:Gfo/Idh/MocA family protein [Planctellipticum variicoloris]|uniref:Gfo/Idh/MocA family protein n=1 Tax=Planctellipticum variicoloris TaxID=3064265 RepID=UPI00301383B6|nr:Gfo/Idh/MocA family oxidoreductase [Planctomycetaceae bacterium SH412]